MPADPVQKQEGGRWRKGESGNPKGRTPGCRNRATLAAQALLDGEAEALTRKAIELALAGDTSALVAATAANAVALTPVASASEEIDAPPASAPGEPSLAAVRAATERFQDVNVALAEGYVRDPLNLCETAEMMGRPAELGAMGIHFAREDLLGITSPPNPRVNGTGTHTDFLTPAILIYEPQADGSLELVAVENLVFARAWEAAGHDAPPSFHGVTYDTMVDDPATPADEAHLFEPHHDRHVWLYRANPNGVFAPFNPAVTCEHHRNGGEHPHHASGG